MCLRNNGENCAVMMVLDCLQLVLPGSNYNLCKTMTLITQHKPIDRSTHMAFMTKKTQIQAWLSSLYTENWYGQRMTSKHISCRAASRRPGTRDDKTPHPIWHHPIGAANNTPQSISRLSKSDLVARNSGSSPHAISLFQ